jgi:hypothetical protein
MVFKITVTNMDTGRPMEINPTIYGRQILYIRDKTQLNTRKSERSVQISNEQALKLCLRGLVYNIPAKHYASIHISFHKTVVTYATFRAPY